MKLEPFEVRQLSLFLATQKIGKTESRLKYVSTMAVVSVLLAGADVMVVSRKGETTVEMANGPVQRVQPYPEAIALLESLGAVNNHNCVSCQ